MPNPYSPDEPPGFHLTAEDDSSAPEAIDDGPQTPEEQRIDECDAEVGRATESGDPHRIADALNHLAKALFDADYYADSLEVLWSAYHRYVEAGADDDALICLGEISALAANLSDIEMIFDAMSRVLTHLSGRDDENSQSLLLDLEKDFGVVAIAAREFAVGEAALLRTITRCEIQGDCADAEEARYRLATLYRMSGRTEEALRLLRQALHYYTTVGPNPVLAASCRTEIAVCGGSEDPVEDLRSAARILQQSGAIGVAADTLNTAAQYLAERGDRTAAHAELVRARAMLENIDEPDSIASCDFQSACLHLAAWELDAAAEAFDAAEQNASVAFLSLARPELQWNRALLQLRRVVARHPDANPGDDRLALHTMISSLLITDAYRFGLPDSSRRLAWRESFANRWSSTFDVAYSIRDTDTLVELIETAVNEGVHTDAAATDDWADLVDVVKTTRATTHRMPPPTDGATILLASGALPSAPPPPLRIAGRIALDRGRRIAAETWPEIADFFTGFEPIDID